jgi:serine/threonine protein kinase
VYAFATVTCVAWLCSTLLIREELQLLHESKVVLHNNTAYTCTYTRTTAALLHACTDTSTAAAAVLLQVLLMTIEQEPPSLKSYKDDRQPDGESFSRSFKEFVRLCLQKNPKKRPNCTTLLNHR